MRISTVLGFGGVRITEAHEKYRETQALHIDTQALEAAALTRMLRGPARSHVHGLFIPNPPVLLHPVTSVTDLQLGPNWRTEPEVKHVRESVLLHTGKKAQTHGPSVPNFQRRLRRSPPPRCGSPAQEPRPQQISWLASSALGFASQSDLRHRFLHTASCRPADE